jgi:hypothetical protein
MGYDTIKDLFSDDCDGMMRVYTYTEEIPNVENLMRKMDRLEKSVNGRPSNHHGSNPRRSK